MDKEKIVVVDFGGQYNQLIARRIRQCHVYSEVWPYTVALEKLADPSVKGIIFTGGPNSVYEEKSPHIDPKIFSFQFSVSGAGFCAGFSAALFEVAFSFSDSVFFDTVSSLADAEESVLASFCFSESVF